MSMLHKLRADARGAILVFGLFMSAFLVGAMYYTIALSQTLLQREGLQQSADSAVFAEAVVASRGMNMIA